MNKGRYHIQTYGCQMNVSDSERLAGLLEGEGYEPAERPEQADVVLVNTCSVRDKAEQKLYSQLGRLRTLDRGGGRGRPIIGVAGCVAQQEREALVERVPEVDLVIGPRSIADLPDMLRRVRRGEGRATAFGYRGSPHESFTAARRHSRLKAFVTVMEGCDRFCTFCVVPFTRGREWSRPPEDIVDEVQGLLDQGCLEITLLGQSILAYGKDRDDPGGFPRLLRSIGALEGLERLRFTTSHPDDVTEDLARAMAETPAVCEQIHLPFQSGSDSILAAMNRNYTRESYLEKVAILRRAMPDLALSADVIVGFPGEREEDFEATLEVLREVRFDGLFSFIYSPRPRTPARRLTPVDREVATERLQRLNALQREISLERYAARIGSQLEVLVEGPSKRRPDVLTGRARDNKIVHFPGPAELRGRLVTVHIDRASPVALFGRLAG